MQTMDALVRTIVELLVDHPEQVEVNSISGKNTDVIELRVAKEDIGKVIGRQGQTARALRTLLNAAGMKVGKRCILEILE
jgi:predicted RNA-binding protein YlqC (UPF0109 family)